MKSLSRRVLRRAARIAALALGGFLLLAALALTPVGRKLLLLAAVEGASVRTGLPVSAGDGDIAPFRGVVTLADVQVGGLVRAKTVTARWRWFGLLRGRIAEVEAAGVVVRLDAPLQGKPGGHPPDIVIERLHISDAEVAGLPNDFGRIRIERFEGSFADGLPRGELDAVVLLRSATRRHPLAPITLTGSLGAAARAPWRLALRSPEIELDARGTFVAEPWSIEGGAEGSFPLQALAVDATGIIDMKAEGNFSASGLRCDWTLESPLIRHPRGRIASVAARGSTGREDWRVTSAQGRIPGGLVHASARGRFAPFSASGEVQLAGFDLLRLAPGIPADFSALYRGGLRFTADRHAAVLTGAGDLVLAHRGAALLSGPLSIETRDAAPQLRAHLAGPAGELSLEPAGARHRFEGTLGTPAFALARQFASGAWPLGLEMGSARITGELDARTPGLNAELAGTGRTGARAVRFAATLAVDSRGWRAEPVEILFGEGSFNGRASGALGFRWPALPPRPFAFAAPPSRLSPKPAAARRRAGYELERVSRRNRAPDRTGSPPVELPLPPAGLLVEGDFRDFPLEALLPEALADWQAGGALNGRVRLRGRALEADFTLAGGRLRAVALPPLRVTATGSDGRWRFRAADAGGAYLIEGVGPVAPEASGRLPVDLVKLLPPGTLPPDTRLEGVLEFAFHQDASGAHLAADLDLPAVRWAGAELGPARIALEGDPARPVFRLRAPTRGLAAEGTVSMRDGAWQAELSLVEAPAQVGALGKPLMTRLGGRFTLAGAGAHAEALAASGWLEAGRVEWGGNEVLYDGGPLLPDPAGWQLPLRAGGTLGAGLGRVAVDPRRGAALILDTRGRAEFISVLLERVYLAGDALGNLRLRFPWRGDAELHGEWDAIHGAFTSHGLPFGLSEASGRVRLDGLHLHLDDMLFVTEGGRGAGAGRLDFGAHGVDGVAIRAGVESTRMRFVPGLGAAADANLAVDYAWDRGWKISGLATILGGRYVPPVAAAGAPAALEPGNPADRVEIDLTIAADGGLELSSPLFRTAASGRLEARGPAASPHLAGRLEGLPGGLLRFRNRQYALNRFILDFSGGPVEEGQLDLEGETAVHSTRVFLAVSGTLGNPRLEFRADGGLDQDNILTLLMTGYTREELLLRNAPLPTQEVLNSYLIDPLGTLGENSGVTGGRLLEYLSLAPSQDPSRGLTAPAVTFGKSVGDNLATLWRYDLGSNKFSFEGEYSLTRTLRLGLTTGTQLGGVGGDLRFYTPFDFGATAAAGREATAVLRVAALTVEGLPGNDPLVARFRKRVRAGRPLPPAALYRAVDALRAGLRKRGNLLARVSLARAEDADGSRITLSVVPGPLLSLEVWDGAKRRSDLQKRLLRLDLDIPFLDEFDQRARAELDAALSAEGRPGRTITSERSGDADAPRLVYRCIAEAPRAASRLAGGDWPEAPPGAPAPADYFPGLRTAPRLTPLPKFRPDWDELALEAQRLRYAAALRAAGYPAATVRLQGEPEGAHRMRARLTIEPGARATVASVSFPADPPPLPAERLPLKAGDPLTGAGLRALRDALQAALWKSGHRKAAVEVRAGAERDGSSPVDAEINAGAPERVAALEITGLVHARPSVVRRRLALREGDPLDPRALDATRTALYRSGVFSQVRIGVEPLDADGAARLSIAVHERPRFELGGSLGWDSEERLRESLQLSHNNFLGRARRLSLGLKNSEIEQRAELTFRDPALFGTPIELAITTRYQYLSTASYDQWRRGFDARASWALSRRMALQGVAQLTRVTLGDVRVSFSASQAQLRERSASVPSIGGALVWNSRDDAFNPARGMLLSVGAEYANPLLTGSDIRFSKFTVTGFHYLPLGPAVWAQGVRAGYISTPLAYEAFPLSERFYAGGDGTVRGFRRDQLGPVDPVTGNPLGGLAQLLVNEELRLPLGFTRSVNVSLFVDGGAVGAERFSLGDLRYSYGMGLFYLSPLGPLRLEYGRPFKPLPGEPSYQIHFAIGRAF